MFYDAAYGFENGFQRTALGSHFENEVLSGEQAVRALSLIDIRLQDAPTEDSAVSISHGETLDMEPSVDTIRAALAEFDIVRVPAFE